MNISLCQLNLGRRREQLSYKQTGRCLTDSAPFAVGSLSPVVAFFLFGALLGRALLPVGIGALDPGIALCFGRCALCPGAAPPEEDDDSNQQSDLAEVDEGEECLAPGSIVGHDGHGNLTARMGQ